MKLNKLPLFLLSSMCLCACDLLGIGGEKEDATLYKLTLTSNKEEVMSELKATYAYGVQGKTVTQGVRDEDEIQALKDAGATDDDIAKAGKKQSDGSYYFFDQDPMYIEAPNSFDGYKFLGFYDKENNKYLYNPYMTGQDGNIPKWNMQDKNMTVEARYEKFTYNYYFVNMEDGVTNPNQGGNYCYVDDGEVALLPPVIEEGSHKSFGGWQYEDIANAVEGQESTWITLEDNKLPINYYEDSLRIAPIIENEKFKISFAFEKYIDPETPNEILTFEEAMVSMTCHGNLTTIDGVLEPCEMSSKGTPITDESEIVIDSVSGWCEFFFTLKAGLGFFYVELNGVRNETINASHMEDPYISINQGDITQDSVITFVLYNE